MKTDEIRRQLDSMRVNVLTVDQQIELMKVEALCEINSTLMYIKNNLR